MYEILRNDQTVVDIYNHIDKTQVDELWSDHGWKHVEKVVKVTEYILEKLNVSEELVQCGKIAALLHDIGVYNGKKNHAEKGYEMAIEILKDKPISDEHKKIILNAIKNHGDIDKVDDIVGKTVVFADKIDFDKTRMLPLGQNIDYLTETNHIERIYVELTKDELIVDFVATDKLNKELLNKYYFIPKIHNAIKGLAEFIGVNSLIRINNEEWVVE